MRPLVTAIAIILMLSSVPAPARAAAQYFGRNKVQYKTLQFEVMRTEHFDIYFYPEEEAAARRTARMAERWYSRLSRLLDHQLTGKQPVVLYASHADFEQTNVLPGFIEEGTGGVTEGLKRRVVLPLAGTLADTDHVLGHELVHAFQYHMAGTRNEMGNAMSRLPLWMVEGMAEYLSIGPLDAHTAMWIRDAARAETLPDIDRLDDPRLFPYRWGQALWAYLAGRFGDEVVTEIFSEALNTGSAINAIRTVAGIDVAQLSEDWHSAIHSDYDPIIEQTMNAAAYGRPLNAGETRTMSVSPVVSPDGSRVVYFSERSLLSVDLYLADTGTGEVIRRLTDTSVSPHFTSLQFIGSAGSWSPDGNRFAVGAITQGQAEIAVIEVDSGRIVREIPFADMGEILNPSWSPDGRRIAFSATRGGESDLFVYDLEENVLDPLTRDAFADLQPAWSPDGQRLAFVTDRFSTDLGILRAGRYELAILDTRTGDVRRLQTFGRGKSINPQWARDGRHLYFLSDTTGLTNVYRIDTLDGGSSQITDLGSAASGITALSPALSVATDADLLAFSAYEAGQLGAYIVDDPARLSGGPVRQDAGSRADALPPARRVPGDLVLMLEDATSGLPSEGGEVEPYHASLSLDAVGQPYVGVGFGGYGGPSFGGGITLSWSDMLGNQNLEVGMDANTYGQGLGELAKNTGVLAAYRNLRHRWNWGIMGQQSPTLSGGFLSGVAVGDSGPVLVEESVTSRQTYRGVQGIVAYPFNPTRRIEFGAGYANLSFNEQVRVVERSLFTNQLLSDQTFTAPSPDPLHQGVTTIAAVGDSATFGALSPIAGERSRLELSPTFGSLSFTTATADYRRYVMPLNFYTIAGRVLHQGRYGSGSEDPRLLPLFMGYPELIRGYGLNSFTPSECTSGPGTTCEEFDRLLGSRMLVGNLELRFPLLRPFGVRSGMYGPLPTEVALFADGGVAWFDGERPSFLGGDRRGVSSAGVTLRFSLFGFAVAQVDAARPFQRPGRGWVWNFSLTPGY